MKLFVHTTLSILVLLACALLSHRLSAQDSILFVDDESCGCETVYIDGIQTTQQGELFGFRSYDGTIISENIFRYVDRFSDGYCRVYIDYGQCGLIDRNGNTIVPFIYDYVDYPSDGRILVNKNNQYGYCNLNGDVVIPFGFVKAGSFSCGRAPVQQLGVSRYTFIDTMGNAMLPLIYDDITSFNDNFAQVRRGNLWGVINIECKEVLPPAFKQITSIVQGFFMAGDVNAMALYDTMFSPLTSPVYSRIGPIAERRIPVCRASKFGFLDFSGREIIPCQYTNEGFFSMGRCFAVKDGYYGIIDTLGNVILPFLYENKLPRGDKYVYHDSLALVEKDGKLGYVDLSGKLAIPFYFDNAYHFSQGLAAVNFNGGWGYINTHGDIYMPFIFTEASPFEWGRAEVIYNGEVRKVDLKGRCVKNCKGIISWR